MLQQPNLSEEDRRDYARTVTNASQRLASLITNILKLNKLENQQIYPKKERFDLGEQLCECLLGFEDAWEAKNLEIETDMEDGVNGPEHRRGDRMDDRGGHRDPARARARR